MNFFKKSFPDSSHRNGNRNNGSDKAKSECGNKVFPRGICSKCGEYKEKQDHHDFPQWISRCLGSFKIYLPKELTGKVTPLCPAHHGKGIEKINQSLSAVVMARYEKQYAEILYLYLNGKDKFTFEELSILADGGSLIKITAIEQDIDQKVEV